MKIQNSEPPYLFEGHKLDKLFEIANKLSSSIPNDKSHHPWGDYTSERDMFIRRVLKPMNGKCFKILRVAKVTPTKTMPSRVNIRYEYLRIGRVVNYNTWSPLVHLSVSVYDVTRPLAFLEENKVDRMQFTFNDLRNLKGWEISEQEWEEVAQYFIPPPTIDDRHWFTKKMDGGEQLTDEDFERIKKETQNVEK